MGSLDAPLETHRHDLLLDSGNEFCTYLPWSWVRAAILIRMNSLLSGVSSARPVVVERMQDLLKHDIIPMIPLRGSISASGDLSPLSYICGAIQGKPTVRILSRDHEHIYADMAFAKAGLEPLELQAKEGLAMTNGTAISTAAAVLALHDTHGLAVMAQLLTAMSVEALNGTAESFHPFLAEVRPHSGQVSPPQLTHAVPIINYRCPSKIESARNILAFLQGSKLTKVNDGAHSLLRQDRYSIRTAPQWLGPILEDLVLSHQQILVECNSATDNPLVTPEGEFLHGGNFQAKSVTSAMEKARQGVQGIGRMIFSQCTELINPATNRGLPPNLVVEDPDTSYIFKGTDLNIASLAAELGFLANPVNHVQTAEMGNQSLNSLALISARYTHMANEVLSQMMAGHVIAACQAFDLRAMQVQFLENYRPIFMNLVNKHYHTVTNASFELPDLMWSQILSSFDSTTSMGVEDRFTAIAKSMRGVLLDNLSTTEDNPALTQLKRFVEELAASLQDAWCVNREAYIAHGDARPLLGKGSGFMYEFVRQTLKVPLLATRHILTPSEYVDAGKNSAAPTVGSYTGAVTRAIRDGTMSKVVVDALKMIQEDQTDI